MGGFESNVKHCGRCGEGTGKADRQQCKACGATEWITQEEAQEQRQHIDRQVLAEAKAMNEMEGVDDEDDEIWRCGARPSIA